MNADTPSAVSASPPTYPAPSHSDLAAVAATVAVVGTVMGLLVAWLVLRLRRTHSTPIHRPTSYVFRPSFAPSEASSTFGFVHKSLRLSHRQHDASWDFADPDPFAHPKESSFDAPAPRHPAPAYTPRAQRASVHKDDSPPRTPITPDVIDLPPPAYHRDSSLALTRF